MSRRWVIAYGVLALLVGTAYFVLPKSPLEKLLLYNGLGAVAVIGMTIGIWRNKPEYRWPWVFFNLGLLSFLVGDVVYYVLEENSTVAPFPSMADFFYLAMYPLMIVGLMLLLKKVAPGRNASSALDAMIVAVSMFAGLWILFVDDTAHDNTLSWAAKIISIAYPVMDVALLAMAVRVGVSIRLRHPAFGMLIIGLGSLVIADTLYNVLTNADAFHTGSYVDAFWLLFYVAFGAAALHPSMAELPHAPDDNGTLTYQRLLMVFLATLMVPLLNLIWGNESDRVVTTLISALLFSLVLVRLIGLMLQVQKGQEQLRHEALHDSLTDLANRDLFSERVEARFESEDEIPAAVMFIDLDDFKTVNDSLGHQAGDELLTAAAARLSACVTADGTVARLGGDEFAILLPDAIDRRYVERVAESILESLREPFPLRDREVRVSASIGITIFDGTSHDVDGLLRGADVAMYLAKARGKGRFEFFEQAMYDEVLERLDLKADLIEAVEHQQFELHYQPIIDFERQKLISVEALIRWNHPRRGTLQPNSFVHLAEETGLIVPIGRWVLREACRTVRQWQLGQPENANLSVSVNLSVRQLYDPDLVGDVTEALHSSGLAPECLTVEITESILMDDSVRCAQALADLKALNVRISIDDFGTGYSSLSYLRNFPVDVIKIDKSFVSELGTSDTSHALVRTVVDLAEALGASAVAEGVETPAQLVALNSLHCRMGQGFYFSHPLVGSALTSVLDSPITFPMVGSYDGGVVPARQSYKWAEVREGVEAISDFADDMDELHRALDLPVMGRWPWLSTWAECHGEIEPVGVFITSSNGAGLQAAALLGRRTGPFGTEWCALGSGPGCSVHLASRNHRAAVDLAEAIANVIESGYGPWTLELEGLHHPDPVTSRLSELWHNAVVAPDLRVPRVRLDGTVGIEAYLSHGMRKQIRRARNRAEADGREIVLSTDSGRDLTPEQVNEIERVHLRRDYDSRRRSDLDSMANRRFWRDVLTAKTGGWEVEVISLRIDGELAAYVIGLVDLDSYRVFDGHMDSSFSRYSPGRLVEAAALEGVLGDPRFTELDWMSGVGAEKLLSRNAYGSRARLTANSQVPERLDDILANNSPILRPATPEPADA